MKEFCEFLQAAIIITVVLLGVATIAKVSAPTPPSSSEVQF